MGIVGKEEHPEFYGGYKFLETDSKIFIRDENYGKEEYPGNCSVIYPSPPCFDEYRDDDWYSWVTGGDRNSPGDEFVVEKESIVGSEAVFSGGDVVVTDVIGVVRGCDRVAYGGVVSMVEGTVFSYIEPKIMDEWNISLVNRENKDTASRSFSLKIQVINIMWGNKKFMVGPILGYCLDTPLAPGCGLHDMFQVIYDEPKEKQKDSDVLHLNGPNKDSHVNKQMGVGQKNLSDLIDEPQMGGSVYESLIKKKHFNVPFDPGGTCLESSDMTREVELFGLVVLIKNQNRVDVPFDPGGVGPKAKLEDEFFSKTGRMMQDYLHIRILKVYL